MIQFPKIGSFIGLEDEEREYKKFTIGRKFISKLNERYIQTKVIDDDFNKIIMESIDIYIKKYFAKYFSVTTRTRSISEYCNFEIGINDMGIITGIPFYGKLNMDDIIELVNKNIRNLRGIYNGKKNNDILDLYLDKLKIIITKVECPDEPIDIDEEYSKYYKKESDKCNKLSKYYRDMSNWKRELRFYNCSLDLICSDINRRKLFLKYCIKNGAPQKICDYIRYTEKIINKVGVRERKSNKNGFDYWITQYKDEHVERIKYIKPVKPYFGKNTDPLVTILLNIDSMNGNWLNANYYVITIKLPFNINPHMWVEYNDSHKWISGIRVISPRGDPACELYY
jgi:hypothetical protein